VSASPSIDAEGRERRSYFRVRTRVSVRYRQASEQEAQTFLSELASRREGPSLPIDPILALRLDRLEQKLDLILATLRRDAEQPLGSEHQQTITLSGNGLEIVSDEPVEPGCEILVELRIPVSPPRVVRALARAVTSVSGANESKGKIALTFEAIDENDREAIIRHVFDVERLERARRTVASEPA
jgi:c-di-GMP-binding flagellar brake protein YcgR